MTDVPTPTEPSVEDAADAYWGLDAAIGAAALVTRTAGEVASGVAASSPAKALGEVARWFARPLTREGEAVRGRLGEEGVPAAKEAIRRVTPGVVDAVDLESVLDAVDVQSLIDRVDVGGLIERVDIDAIVGRVDIDGLLSRVDVGALIGRIDLNALLAGVDLNALLAGVDLNAVLADLDLNAVLAGVDLNSLLADLDLNAVVDRLDVDALMANTELGGVIVRSTGGVASEALDAVRSQGVSIDSVIARVANRMLRRDTEEFPTGPPRLVDRTLELLPADGDGEPADGDGDRAGDGERGGDAGGDKAEPVGSEALKAAGGDTAGAES